MSPMFTTNENNDALKTYITRIFDIIETMHIIAMIILTAFILIAIAITFCALRKQRKANFKCCNKM